MTLFEIRLKSNNQLIETTTRVHPGKYRGTQESQYIITEVNIDPTKARLAVKDPAIKALFEDFESRVDTLERGG